MCIIKNKLDGRTITSLADVRTLMEEFVPCGMNGIRRMYRGHSDASWELECSLKRYKEKMSERELFEQAKRAYQEFKKFALQQDWQKFKLDSMHEDFFYLSMGRHLGLVCNLLDWSASLETAVEFAVQENPDKDGCVYVLMGRYEILKAPLKCSPFDFENLPKNTVIKDFDFIPDDSSVSDFPLARKRRMHQNGLFTVSIPETAGTEKNIFWKKDVLKWHIPASAKPCLKKEISQNRQDECGDWLLVASDMERDALQRVREINEKYFNSK